MNGRPAKKPRGAYSLGGCGTCRRRHVKCDKVRPHCLTCQAVGASCDGFQYTGIKWITNGDPKSPSNGVNEISNRKSRRALYPVQSQASMSQDLTSTLSNKTVDDLLSTIEAKSKDGSSPNAQDLRAGPFGVFSIEDESSASEPRSRCSGYNAASAEVLPKTDQGTKEKEISGKSRDMESILDLDSWLNSDNLLDWQDIFDLDTTPPWLPPELHTEPGVSHVEDVSATADCINSIDSCDVQSTDPNIDQNETSRSRPPEPISSAVLSPDHAQLLLRHYSECTVAHVWSLPLGQKSSMDIHIDAAVTTLARLTFMKARPVSKAALSHFYSVLSMAAMQLSSTVQSTNPEQSRSLAERLVTESQRNYQYSIQHEMSPKRAKYKDLVMAVSSILCFAILYDRQDDARTYMVESERLLRTCGLAKTSISRKASYLHHTYTWARIVGESTYVLRKYHASESKTRSMRHGEGSLKEPRALFVQRPAAGNFHPDPYPGLDDFLGLEPLQTEDGVCTIGESPATVGDIHLQSCEGKSDSALRFLYGISETWLSLVSQTTRLANFVEKLATRPEKLDNAFLESLEVRKNQLENMIWAHAGNNSSSRKEFPAVGNGQMAECSSNPTPRKPSASPRTHLVRALKHALVIFFYRRIRDVHPRIVQQQVECVIQALRDFDSVCEKEGIEGPGSPWPAFIAGCEAMSSNQRQFLLSWLQKSFKKTGFARFNTIISCMQEVWRRQADALKAGNQDWTWVQVSKEQNIYVMLC